MVQKNPEEKDKVKVNIEDKSGFCFGVTRVIKAAEEILDRGEELYCLGQIVHNEKEVDRLVKKGIKFIEHSDLENLHDVKVLVRAHGEPPSTYQTAERNHIELIDGTCPIVKKLQTRIRSNYQPDFGRQRQIIIYGKDKHPEVIALKGQTGNKAVVISQPEDVKQIEAERELSLFSQTTMDKEGFLKLAGNIREMLIEKYGTDEGLSINNTICGHISHRQPGLEDFSLQNDVVIFVSGKKSSNGKVLFEVCRRKNERTYFISDTAELKAEWFDNAQTAGICGATSTPRWFLDEVAEAVGKLK